MAAEGKWALHVLLLRKQPISDSPQESGSWSPKVLCEARWIWVGYWTSTGSSGMLREGKEEKVGVRRQFGTIQWFRSARAAGSSGCLNLNVKHWSVGTFNTGFSLTIPVCIPSHMLSLCSGKLMAGWLRAELATCLVSPGAQPVLYTVAGARFLHAFSLASPFRCPKSLSQDSSFLCLLGNEKLEESYLFQAGGADHVSN